MEDGRWKMEDGGWRMEDGGWGSRQRAVGLSHGGRAPRDPSSEEQNQPASLPRTPIAISTQYREIAIRSPIAETAY